VSTRTTLNESTLELLLLSFHEAFLLSLAFNPVTLSNLSFWKILGRLEKRMNEMNRPLSFAFLKPIKVT
jgi:hypothetical protein